MKKTNAEKVAQEILELSDVQINGDRSWDIQIHNPDFYERVFSGGSIALGESYMDGWWECKALDQFFEKILEARLNKKVKTNAKRMLWIILKAKITNAQKWSRAYAVSYTH